MGWIDRRNYMPKDDKGKIKIRFFEVELEGGNETLLEGVRTAAAVASRGSASVKVIKALPSVQAVTHDHDAAVVETVEDTDDAGDTGGENGTQPKAKKNRSYSQPKLVEIDLSTAPSLESFCKPLPLNEDSKKYLAVAAWLKEHRATPVIGIDHVWTCFRAMGWGVQKDMGQPLRQMAKRQGWFKTGSERGTFEISHIGLDVVRKMNAPA